MDHVHGDFRTLFAQGRSPAGDVVPVENVRQLGPEPAGLHQRRRHDAPGSGPAEQVQDHRSGDAETDHPELVDAEMVHQTKMVVGKGIPRPVNLQRAGGLARRGIAQVGGDAAKISLEGFQGIERMRGSQALNGGIESAARTDQKREARTDLFVIDACGASFVERHGDFLHQ